MTSREYKKLCRIKVAYYSRLFSWLLVVLFSVLMPGLGIPEWAYISLPITIWFWAPVIITYILETKYKLTHEHH